MLDDRDVKELLRKLRVKYEYYRSSVVKLGGNKKIRVVVIGDLNSSGDNLRRVLLDILEDFEKHFLDEKSDLRKMKKVIREEFESFGGIIFGLFAEVIVKRDIFLKNFLRMFLSGFDTIVFYVSPANVVVSSGTVASVSPFLHEIAWGLGYPSVIIINFYSLLVGKKLSLKREELGENFIIYKIIANGSKTVGLAKIEKIKDKEIYLYISLLDPLSFFAMQYLSYYINKEHVGNFKIISLYGKEILWEPVERGLRNDSSRIVSRL